MYVWLNDSILDFIYILEDSIQQTKCDSSFNSKILHLDYSLVFFVVLNVQRRYVYPCKTNDVWRIPLQNSR